MPEKDLLPSKKDGNLPCVDNRENDLLAISADVLNTLLHDHTTGQNIFWATHDYESLGSEYGYYSPIMPELITGDMGMVIRPREYLYAYAPRAEQEYIREVSERLYGNETISRDETFLITSGLC